MDFHEQSIQTYSGLSTETKPTAAAGNKVPNGSRFREVDTGIISFYNESDDTWYAFDPRTVLTDGTNTVSLHEQGAGDFHLGAAAVIVGQQNEDRHVWVNPTNELAVSPVYRLVGTTFIGTTLDPNFWTPAVANDGTVTESGGYVELKTSATANGSASITSVRKGRFVAGSAMLMAGAVNWVTAGTAGNVRRVGAYTATDGYFFQLSGATFSVGTRVGSSDTLVNSGSFNGNLGATFVPTADTYYKITIEWTPIGALFYINGVLLHKIGGAILSATPTLPIMIDNDNGAITTDISFKCLGLYIARQGELITNPTYYHVSGNAVAEKVLKYGAGVLQKVVYNNVSGTSLTLYDGISVATGDIIGIITTTANAIGVWNYNVPFSTGLTIATVGNSLDATIIYE